MGGADQYLPGLLRPGAVGGRHETFRLRLHGPAGRRTTGRRRYGAGRRPGTVARGGDRGHRHGAQYLLQRHARPRVGGADHSEHQARLLALEFENPRFNPDA